LLNILGVKIMKGDKQTVGEFFREVRKEKGISIDEISRETNISKKYLEAIESDNFEIFPGETYIMGFISNYADALELDRDTLIGLYKKQKQIEQNSPIEELIGKKDYKKARFPLIFTFSIIIITILLIIIFLNIRSIRGVDSKKKEILKTYYFDFDNLDKISVQKFKLGENIIISNNIQYIEINLNKITNNNSIYILINSNEVLAKLGELVNIDIDKDQSNDYSLVFYNIKNKDIRLTFSKFSEIGQKELSATKTLSKVEEINLNQYNKYKEYIISESEILTSPSKIKPNIKILSSGYGWLSYCADEKDEIEMEITNGMNIMISFDNSLLLFIGNSGVVKIITSDKEEIAGGYGEVTKSLFYWKIKDNMYVLVRSLLK